MGSSSILPCTTFVIVSAVSWSSQVLKMPFLGYLCGKVDWPTSLTSEFFVVCLLFFFCFFFQRWSLGCWRSDAYTQKYGIRIVDCAKSAGSNNPNVFYRNQSAKVDFKNRLSHILNHKNAKMGNLAWKDLSKAIFTFQPENEPRWDSNPEWLSEMSAHLKTLTKIPISTGGPAGGGSSPNPIILAKDPSIDILTIHDYAVRLTSLFFCFFCCCCCCFFFFFCFIGKEARTN